MASAIMVDGLWKQYRIAGVQRLGTFREAVMDMVKRPFRRRRTKDSIWALKNISLEVEEGEVVGIIGRNGAGKSTLLKVLSRITYPTTGSFKVRGKVASLLEVGTGFHWELTGRENIYLNGSILGMKKREIDAKLDAIISFGGVEKFIETPIKWYSSGMRLRLGFAVAAHLDPDVLLVDEVLAVGDIDFQKKCLDAMDDMRSGGRTVLFVSHNMAAIENLCPRTIWVDNGEVREDGDSKEVIKNYLATFAGSGQSGMDLRHIKPRHGTGEVRFTSLEFIGPDGRPHPVIRSGDSLTLRLHYETVSRAQAPHFGVMIFTDLGTKVTTMSTWANGVQIPELHPGESYVDLNIDLLNLMPARYYLSLWIKTTTDVTYDQLDHCLTMDVEASDYYGSGKGIDARFGLVFIPCSWVLHDRRIGTDVTDREEEGPEGTGLEESERRALNTEH